jgi:hypothetical protein
VTNRSLKQVVWSGLLTAIISVVVICLFAVVIATPLLLLGFTRSHLIWQVALGVSGMSMAFVPALLFQIRRRAVLYPFDAIGLLLFPLATPFVTVRVLHITFPAVWQFFPSRAADGTLIISGCAFLLVASWSFASLFFHRISLRPDRLPI